MKCFSKVVGYCPFCEKLAVKTEKKERGEVLSPLLNRRWHLHWEGKKK